MKKVLIFALTAMMCQQLMAIKTTPIKGTIISPTDKHIQYTGRISFTNPERPACNFPGIQIRAAFEGTSLRMMAKPNSGYFVAQIDKADPSHIYLAVYNRTKDEEA